MDDWEHLAFRLAQMRVYFWAARQVLMLLSVTVIFIAFTVEVALAGHLSLLVWLLGLLRR